MLIWDDLAEQKLRLSVQQQEMREDLENQKKLSGKSISELLADIEENAKAIRQTSWQMLGIG